MELYYGLKNLKDDSNKLYLTDTKLDLPYGITFFEKPIPFLNDLCYKTLDNTKVPQLFTFRNFSLWWFILPSFNYAVCDAINFIDRFEKFIITHNPSSVKVLDNFEKLDIIKQICLKQKIPCRYSKLSFYKFQLLKWIRSFTRSIYYKKILKKKIKKRLKLFSLKKKSIPNFKNKLILFSATVYRRKYFDFKQNKEISKEFLLDPLIPQFKKMNLDLLGIDVDYTFKGELEILHQRLDDQIEWIPLESISFEPKFDEETKLILDSYNKIIKNFEFKNLFTYNKINFWSRLESDFKKNSSYYYIPYFITMTKSFEEFFKNSKPKAVIIPYEKGPYALAMIIACKNLGIKTIGIQHGAFDSLNHIDYAYTDLRTELNPYGMPIPDTTLVWGNSAKKFLMHIGYPEKSIIVLGNPEFFDIDSLRLNSNYLKNKFKIPKEKKIILFTTSKLQRGNIRDEKRAYDEFVLEKLLKLFSNNPEYLIIVKPHPVRETTWAYEKLINNYKATNFVLKRDNVLELIQLSDVMISIESSTIIDAIALGKMVIEMTFNDSSWMDREQAEKILLLSNLEKLEDNIQQILYDDELRQQLQEGQHEFLREHYNIPAKNIFENLNNAINS